MSILGHDPPAGGSRFVLPQAGKGGWVSNPPLLLPFSNPLYDVYEVVI